MSALHSILTLGLSVALVFSLSGCKKDGHYETKPTGYTQEARREPFLVANYLLQDFNYGELASLRNLASSDDYYGTVFLRIDAVLEPVEVRRVRELIADDVHVVLFLGGADGHLNDWTTPDHRFGDWLDESVFTNSKISDLIYEMGMTAEWSGASGERVQKVRFLENEYSVSTPTSWKLGYLDADGDSEVIGGADRNKDFLPIVSAAWGGGRLTVVANARPFRNRFISDFDHADLFFALVDVSTYDDFAVVESGAISFFGLVWDRGWMVVVAVGIGLVIWLWRMMKRRAPIREPVPISVTRYRDRIETTAKFISSQGSADLLVAAVRRSVAAKWRLVTGQALEQNALPSPDEIAERINGAVNVSDIRSAFTATNFSDHRNAEKAIATLQSVHRSL